LLITALDYFDPASRHGVIWRRPCTPPPFLAGELSPPTGGFPRPAEIVKALVPTKRGELREIDVAHGMRCLKTHVTWVWCLLLPAAGPHDAPL
jgi:hypothetical protein